MRFFNPFSFLSCFGRFLSLSLALVLLLILPAKFLYAEELSEEKFAEEVSEKDEQKSEDVEEASEAEEGFWEEGEFKKAFDYYGALMGGYSLDEESGLNKAEGEWAMSFSYGDLTGRLRIGDFTSFPNERKPVKIEKYQLNIPTGNFEFSAGTFPATWAKGLVLNSFEERNLNYDNELEGVMMKADAGSVKCSFLVAQQKFRSERSSSKFAGSRLEWNVLKGLAIGGSWLSENEPALLAGAPRSRKKSVTYGVDASFSREHFSLNVEYARLDAPFGYPDGRGLYANATIKYPGFGLTFERKDYKMIAHRLGVPPPTKYTPEHAYSDPNSEKGYAFSSFIAPFKNSSYFEVTYDQSNTQDGGFLQTETIFSYYSPREESFTYALHRSRYKNPSLEDKFWRVETQYAFRNGNSLVLNVELTDYAVGASVRKEQKVELGFTMGTWLSVNFTQEKLPRGSLKERQWWNLLEMKIQRQGKDSLAITFGKRRAGFVCSGGVCRLEPEFDGWKIFYTRYF